MGTGSGKDGGGGARRRRGPRAALISLAGACLLLSASGCASTSSTPRDLSKVCPATSVRCEEPPLGPVLVRLESDRRPLEEHGLQRSLGRSHLAEEALLEPADVAFLRIVARDLVAAGVATHASVVAADQPYTLSVTVLHAGATYDAGIEDLTVILPTSQVEGHCEVRLVLSDRDGRSFLDETYQRVISRSASLLSGLQSTAVRALADAMRQTIDQALPRIRHAPTRFWDDVGAHPR